MRTAAALLGALLPLLAAAAASPATPASSLIAYTDGGGSVFVASTQATSATKLYDSDSSSSMQTVDLSPDGKQVLAISYGDQTQLVLLPVAGGAPVVVPGADGAVSGSFSPDGTKVVFSIPDGASDTLSAGIYAESVAGGTPARVVATPADATDVLPRYSPDGTKLAFIRDAYDAAGNETVTIELAPAPGSPVKDLTNSGVAADVWSGGHLSFSPDGTKIAFAGDSDNPGIFTVGVADGAVAQLTSDFDYWPSFSSDGSKVYFSRDSTSTNADDFADTPVAPADDDLYELWTVKKDGTGPAVVAEGDFEDLALAAFATSGSSGSSGATGSTPPVTTVTKTPTAAGVTVVKKPTVRSATSISVKRKGLRYIVAWRGKAAFWRVTLKVGSKTASVKVKGSVHTHTFLLHGARGTATARVVVA